MQLDKTECVTVLEALRTKLAEIKYNNPDDFKTLSRIVIIIDRIEDELGVEDVGTKYIV